MRQSDSEQVFELFKAGVQDWTPAQAAPAACVLFAPVHGDADAAKQCAAILSDSERERAGRFVTARERDLFVQRRAFRRYCAATALGGARPLTDIAFDQTEKGRPFLPERTDIWFSFSACGAGFLGAWSATYAIGVDLEDLTQDLEAVELAQRFFTQAEATAIEGAAASVRLQTFLRLWTLKEAALKSIGEGLPFGLDAFAFELSPTPRIVRVPDEVGSPEEFDAHVIEDGDCCAALVIRERSSISQGQSDGKLKGADAGAEIS